MPAAITPTPTPHIARPAPAPRWTVTYGLADLLDDIGSASGLGPVALVALAAIAAAVAGAVVGFFVSL